LLILFAITAVSLQGVLDRNRTAFWLLVGSVLIAMVADLVFGLVLIELKIRTATGRMVSTSCHTCVPLRGPRPTRDTRLPS